MQFFKSIEVIEVLEVEWKWLEVGGRVQLYQGALKLSPGMAVEASTKLPL